MPAAIKMQREFEGDLQVVLVEVQGHDLATVEQAALGYEWMGTSAVWTTERPVRTNARGIPNCVVLDADGNVALMGHPMALHSDIEELINQSRRSSRKPPEDLPRELKDAWKNLHKGAFSEAIEDCEQVAQRASDPEVATAASAMAEDARAQAATAVARIGRMVEEGWLLEARDQVDDLVDNVAGIAQVEADAKRWLERLEGDEFEAELDAEKDVRKLEMALFKNGLDERLARVFDKLVEKHPGTKAAALAQRYATACREG